MRRRALVLLLLLASACSQRRTRPDECARLLDRIVELELDARGFRDPALAQRFKAAVRQDLAPALERCHSRPWDAAHAACVERAASLDELRRHCLGQ